jgi:hypothetical protein
VKAMMTVDASFEFLLGCGLEADGKSKRKAARQANNAYVYLPLLLNLIVAFACTNWRNNTRSTKSPLPPLRKGAHWLPPLQKGD